jgi:hypothetical protein
MTELMQSHTDQKIQSEDLKEYVRSYVLSNGSYL